MIRKPLPVGVDDFEKLIRNGYYYVDKTLFIRELLDKKGDVSLFTRPRRFGKTLTLSMLKCFFENTGSEERNCENKKLFEGLSIYSCGSIYTEQMGKYPEPILHQTVLSEGWWKGQIFRSEESWRY